MIGEIVLGLVGVCSVILAVSSILFERKAKAEVAKAEALLARCRACLVQAQALDALRLDRKAQVEMLEKYLEAEAVTERYQQALASNTRRGRQDDARDNRDPFAGDDDPAHASGTNGSI